jgi:glutamate-5-semialdehyde dehydrogenase
MLVDEVVRPALESVGVPGAAVGLVRGEDRAGALALASLPDLVPLVILRGSGPVTAELARHAAGHGVQVLAHAEGGGVLYLDRAADEAKSVALIAASLDRLGVCNRLNLLLLHRDVADRLGAVAQQLDDLGITLHGTERARALVAAEPLSGPIGHEWANDAEHVRSVTVDVVESVEEACAIANRETSGLAAAIVTEDADAAAAFLDGYRGTAAFWNAPTRFTDGFALTGSPETGINVDRVPGPRGPVTYRDLYLRQFRVVGDGTQHR